MHTPKEDLAVFDFTDAEARVLLALSDTGPLRVSALARKARVPRTTTYHVLLRLRERGVVKKISKGHLQRYWNIVRPEKLRKRVREGVADLVGPREEALLAQTRTKEGIDAHDIGIMVYRGKEQIQRAYETVLDLSKTERVLAIQGNRSAEAGLKKLEKQYLFGFHEKLKKAHIIMEGVNGEHALDLFKTLDVQSIASHLDRMLIATFLPDAYMDFSMDILIFRDTVLFISAEEELVIFIRHKQVVSVFTHLGLLLQESGRRIDLNVYLRKLIEEKRKA